jgi:hypothetical protein
MGIITTIDILGVLLFAAFDAALEARALDF